MQAVGAYAEANCQSLKSEMQANLHELFQPRIIACVTGAYPGGRSHALDLPTARDIILITRSSGCVVHVTTCLSEFPEACVPLEGFFDIYGSSLVPLLNTSRACRASQAVAMIEFGLQFLSGNKLFSRTPLIKLEILDSALMPVPAEILECLKSLPDAVRLRTLPFLPPIPAVIQDSIELGCPAIRLAAGQIGTKSGILDQNKLKAAVEAAYGTPVVFEGGLDSAYDIMKAAELGATAVLVNSAFALAKDPREKAKELRKAADQAWTTI